MSQAAELGDELPRVKACAAWLFACCLLGGNASGACAQDATEAASLAKAKQCFLEGEAAYAHGDLKKARDAFVCAYELAPSPELAWNLARVHERMGEVQKSVRFYERCLAAGPKTARERKDIERRIARLDALAQRQREQLREEPPSAALLGEEGRAFFTRGVKLYRSGRFEAAMAAFGAALRASDAPELRYNLAVTAERLGQRQDALDHYRAYLAALPEAEDKEAILARIESLRARLP